MSSITFKIQLFSTKKIIEVTASQFETLDAILSSLTDSGRLPQREGFTFLPLYNGKSLNTFLSLSSCGITTNKTIILFEKLTPKPNSERFEEFSYISEQVFNGSEEEREYKLEASLVSEQCRLADLGFSGLECETKATQILNEMYELDQAQLAEEDLEHHNFELFMQGTIVTKPTKICDKPLPRSFLLSD